MGERRQRGPVPIDEVVGLFLREKGLSRSGGHARVFAAWRDLLDEGLRRRARAVRFRRGELLVEVDSAPHLHELTSFTGETLRRELNGRLGSQVVRRIVFKPKG